MTGLAARPALLSSSRTPRCTCSSLQWYGNMIESIVRRERGESREERGERQRARQGERGKEREARMEEIRRERDRQKGNECAWSRYGGGGGGGGSGSGSVSGNSSSRYTWRCAGGVVYWWSCALGAGTSSISRPIKVVRSTLCESTYIAIECTFGQSRLVGFGHRRTALSISQCDVINSYVSQTCEWTGLGCFNGHLKTRNSGKMQHR